MSQTELVFPVRPLFGAPNEARATPLEAFRRFLEHNPHVYGYVVALARDLKMRGFRRAGMRAIFERLRWMYAIETRGEEYKLNNSWTPFMARLVMAQEKDLEGFFELRGCREAPVLAPGG